MRDEWLHAHLSQYTLKHLWPSPSQRPSIRGKDPYLQDYNSPFRGAARAPGRSIDTSDVFKDYHKIDEPGCSLSSLDLHTPFHPLCQDRAELLMAMSNGGRVGIDAPYMPHGCDMRWFSNDELCEILSRFSLVYMIGDSMIRSNALAMHSILRRDLVRGQNTGWLPDPEGQDCSCARAWESSKCGWNGVFATSYVIQSDPKSLYCPIGTTAPIQTHIKLGYPLDGKGLKALQDELPKERPAKPVAFVYGHGGWNGFNETATMLWVDQIQGAILEAMPWLENSKAADGVTPLFWPRLFVTPNAAGPNKPDQFILTQGNAAVMRFENNITRWIREDVGGGMESLGIYNLTVQNTSPDGTHAGMRSSIIKAMMVFNWLSMLDTTPYYS